MAQFIQLTSCSVSAGSTVVTVTGNHDLSSVLSGWALYLGNNLAEILQGTPAVNGTSTITLAAPWDGATLTTQPAKIIPVAGGLLEAVAGLKSTNSYAIAVHKALQDYTVLDQDVTLALPDGTNATFASLPKIQRIIDESVASQQSSFDTQITTQQADFDAQLSAQQTSFDTQLTTQQANFDAQFAQQQADVDALLDQTAVDGNDQTPGALLTVGATVKQLNLTNSNIEFTPNVKPTLVADFVNQQFELYEGGDNGFVSQPYEDIFTHTRSTTKTAINPLGKVVTHGINKPAYEFERGVGKGLSVTQSYTNLLTGSDSFSHGWGVDDIQSKTSLNINLGTIGEVIPSTVLSDHFVHNGYFAVTPNTEYSISCWVANNSDYRARFIFRSNGTVPINSGAFGPSDGENLVVEETSDAKRFAYTFTTPSDCSDLQVRLYLYDGSSISFAGDGVKAFRGGMIQLTATPYPMPYAKTEGSAVTVAADDVVRTLGDEFNSSEFTIVLHITDSVIKPTDNAERLISITDGTDANFISLRHLSDGGGTIDLYIRENNSTVHDGDPTLMSTILSEGGRIALVNTGTAIKYYSGGILRDTANLTYSQTLTIIDISRSVRAAKSFGFFKLYPVALSEAECIQLTKI